MLFVLPILAAVAEVASLGASAGTAVAGAAIAAGVGKGVAGTVGTIAAGSTTTALNVGVAKTVRSLTKD